MITPQIKVYKDKNEVAKNVALEIQKISESDVVHIALSGGSTPKLLFQILSSDFNQSINWKNIHLYWGDERCVPPSDEDSNFKMTKENLLDKVDIPEENIHRVKGENDPKEESNRYGTEVQENVAGETLPVFDLIILGMGTDGHTASIFPHQMELLNDDNICAVATHPDSGQNRVTLTGPVINNAKRVFFLVTGQDKEEKVQSILEKKDNYQHYPAYHISPNQGELIWYLDSSAAGLLS